VIEISAGETNGMALTQSGAVFDWGPNGDGQLGIGSDDSMVHWTPLQVLAGNTGLSLSGRFHKSVEG
jgi:alpha-tubulin suppressor-like RCC1 family protein